MRKCPRTATLGIKHKFWNRFIIQLELMCQTNLAYMAPSKKNLIFVRLLQRRLPKTTLQINVMEVVHGKQMCGRDEMGTKGYYQVAAHLYGTTPLYCGVVAFVVCVSPLWLY